MSTIEKTFDYGPLIIEDTTSTAVTLRQYSEVVSKSSVNKVFLYASVLVILIGPAFQILFLQLTVFQVLPPSQYELIRVLCLFYVRNIQEWLQECPSPFNFFGIETEDPSLYTLGESDINLRNMCISSNFLMNSEKILITLSMVIIINLITHKL